MNHMMTLSYSCHLAAYVGIDLTALNFSLAGIASWRKTTTALYILHERSSINITYGFPRAVNWTDYSSRSVEYVSTCFWKECIIALIFLFFPTSNLYVSNKPRWCRVGSKASNVEDVKINIKVEERIQQYRQEWQPICHFRVKYDRCITKWITNK